MAGGHSQHRPCRSVAARCARAVTAVETRPGLGVGRGPGTAGGGACGPEGRDREAPLQAYAFAARTRMAPCRPCSGWRWTCRPGCRPIGGLPKDLNDLVVPPLQSLTHDQAWLDSAGRPRVPRWRARRARRVLPLRSAGHERPAVPQEIERRTPWRAAARGAGGRPRRGPAGRELDGGQRLQVLDTLIACPGGRYAHLPPSGRPTPSTRCRPSRCSGAARVDLSDAEFHRAVTSIVTGLRDAHTRYIGPLPPAGQRRGAAVPGRAVRPGRRPRYLVTKVDAEEIAGDRFFEPGVELESWNGIPFARAVEMYADRGDRRPSRLAAARALES